MKSQSQLAKIDTKSLFTVTGAKGKEMFALAPKFKTELVTLGNEVGGFIQNAEQKMQTTLNLTAAFNEYKRITNNGLPAFVHDMLDATCPKSYGKVGSTDRQSLTSHKLFNGIEYLYRKGKAALERVNTRKALSDAGIDPDNATDVGKHTKEERDAATAKFQAAFNRCLISMDQHGISETTVANLLIIMGKTTKAQPDELTKSGVTIRDSAINAVLKARGNRERNVTPARKAAAKK